MTWASPKVEINFKTSLAGTDNWVDVTADVVSSISIKRGRQSELDTYSAGTCSFDLINRSRKYDFTYASGPYFGKLLPRNECRVTATTAFPLDWNASVDWNSTDDWDAITGVSTSYNLFRGFIQGWPQSYDNMTQMSTVKINAVDRFDILAQTKVLSGAATSYLKLLAPDFWLRSVYDSSVSSSTDPTKFIKRTSSEDGRYTLIFRNNNSWANSDDGNAIQADVAGKGVARFENQGSGAGATAGHAYTQFIPTNILAVTNTFSVGGWFRTTTPATQPQTTGTAGMMAFGGLFASGGVQFNFQWSGLPTGAYSRFIANVRHAGGTPVNVSLNYDSSIADDLWHQIVVTNATNDLRLYIDGLLVGSSSAFGSNTLDDSAVLGVATTQAGGFELWNGWTYDIFGFNRTLSSTEIANLYQAGINLPNQVSGARINSLLLLFGLSSIPNTISPGQSVIADATAYVDNSMLDILQEVAHAEDGPLYIDADGTLIFRGRLDILTKARSTSLQATFDDSGANIPYIEASPTLDIQFMYNQISTSVTGGIAHQLNDIANQSAYGVRSLDRTGLALLNDNDAIDQGQWNLAKYATPKARLPFVVVDPRISNAAMTAALSLTLLDKVRVARTPQNVGPSWSFDAHIEGIDMDIDLSNLDWRITYSLTQTGIITGYMQLDSSSSGRLDTAKLAG